MRRTPDGWVQPQWVEEAKLLLPWLGLLLKL